MSRQITKPRFPSPNKMNQKGRKITSKEAILNFCIDKNYTKCLSCGKCQKGVHANITEADKCLKSHGFIRCFGCFSMLKNCKVGLTIHHLENHFNPEFPTMVKCFFCKKMVSQFMNGLKAHVIQDHFQKVVQVAYNMQSVISNDNCLVTGVSSDDKKCRNENSKSSEGTCDTDYLTSNVNEEKQEEVEFFPNIEIRNVISLARNNTNKRRRQLNRFNTNINGCASKNVSNMPTANRIHVNYRVLSESDESSSKLMTLEKPGNSEKHSGVVKASGKFLQQHLRLEALDKIERPKNNNFKILDMPNLFPDDGDVPITREYRPLTPTPSPPLCYNSLSTDNSILGEEIAEEYDPRCSYIPNSEPLETNKRSVEQSKTSKVQAQSSFSPRKKATEVQLNPPPDSVPSEYQLQIKEVETCSLPPKKRALKVQNFTNKSPRTSLTTTILPIATVLRQGITSPTKKKLKPLLPFQRFSLDNSYSKSSSNNNKKRFFKS